MTRCNNSECGHLNESDAALCASCGRPLPRVDGLEEELKSPVQDIELPLKPFTGTPEEIEKQWYENVYKRRDPNMLQLTFRAVLMGSLLGGVLSLTNVYIGLKAGWAMGVAITACILSYAIWTTLLRIGIARSPMSILENNCMQSTASAAGMSTGGTLVSAFSAYVLINNVSMPIMLMFAWVFLLAVLGVTMAIPMKRQMVNVEQLRFPSGIAAAETLRALHSHGQKGMRAAKALGIAGIIAALNQFWAEGFALIDKLKLSWLKIELGAYSLSTYIADFNEKVLGPTWMQRTVAFNLDPVFIAAGALSGLRVCLSMLIGGTLCWAVFVPILQANDIIHGVRFKDIVQWTLWGGVSCMVTSGLLAFVLQWKSIIRTFKSIKNIFAKNKSSTELDQIEAPMSWFVIGQVAALIGLSYLGHVTFGMPWWQSAFAIFVSFFFAMVACRVTGETDMTPMGPMGKITQLMFGVISPGNVNVNLMAANITSGAASSSADLLIDLKSGYLLGANPRKQFIAQFAGIFAGTICSVLCFKAIVTDASVLGTEQFPAPAAQTWKAVAETVSKGLSALEPIKVWSMFFGGLVGIILPLLSKFFPKHDKFIPSAPALGLAWTFQWYTSFLFFLGAFLGWIFEKRSPEKAKEFTFPIASGLIAGGSLMGVLLVFCENGKAIILQLRQFFGF